LKKSTLQWGQRQSVPCDAGACQNRARTMPPPPGEWTHTFLLTLPGFTIDNSEQNRRKEEKKEEEKKRKKEGVESVPERGSNSAPLVFRGEARALCIHIRSRSHQKKQKARVLQGGVEHWLHGLSGEIPRGHGRRFHWPTKHKSRYSWRRFGFQKFEQRMGQIIIVVKPRAADNHNTKTLPRLQSTRTLRTKDAR
jgi:hypothetical protein